MSKFRVQKVKWIKTSVAKQNFLKLQALQSGNEYQREVPKKKKKIKTLCRIFNEN
jgi:hypothetical protein